jgi:hypothetical protein
MSVYWAANSMWAPALVTLVIALYAHWANKSLASKEKQELANQKSESDSEI